MLSQSFLNRSTVIIEEDHLSGEDHAKLKSLKMKGLLHYNRNRLVPAAACYEKALNMALQMNNGLPTSAGSEYARILESLNKCRRKMGKGEYGEEEDEDEW